MTIKTQGIAPLGLAVQQHNTAPLAAIKADQARTLTASDTQDLQYQRHLADTSGGSVTITLKPLAEWPPFVPFHFQKISASNTMTIDGDGSETIEGNATIAVTGNNTVISLYSDGTTLRRYTEGATASGVAGALLAANNLSDLASAATARTNLGGTTVGKAVFTAASEAAAQTAIGATATGASVLTAANAAAAQTALGATVTGAAVFTAADAAAGRTALAAAANTLAGVASVSLSDYADDAAAAVGGIAVGSLYRTGSIIKVRVA